MATWAAKRQRTAGRERPAGPKSKFVMRADLRGMPCSNQPFRTRRTAGLRGCESRVQHRQVEQTVFGEQLEPRALDPAIGHWLLLAKCDKGPCGTASAQSLRLNRAGAAEGITSAATAKET